MTKKIIAVSLVVLLVAVSFAACGKKAQTINVNGKEYTPVTDDEGNTVLTDDGEIAVYVTDAKGKYVKDANGEKQTDLVNFPNKLVNGSILETPVYKWTLPEGWTLNSSGIAYKDGTEEGIYVKVVEIDPQGKNSLEVNVQQNFDVTKAQIEEFKKTYPDSAVELKDVKFSDDSIDGKYMTVYIKDNNGKMLHYADGIFFEISGKTYKIEYASINGHYDETIDLLAMLKTFKLK